MEFKYFFINETALYIASKHGSVDIVLFLLSFPIIDINIPDFKGVTPLMIASYYNNEEIVKLLCQDERINFDMVDEDILINFFLFIKILQ